MGRRSDDDLIDDLTRQNGRLKLLITLLLAAWVATGAGAYYLYNEGRTRAMLERERSEMALKEARDAAAKANQALKDHQKDLAKLPAQAAEAIKAMGMGDLLKDYSKTMQDVLNDPAINPGGAGSGAFPIAPGGGPGPAPSPGSRPK